MVSRTGTFQVNTETLGLDELKAFVISFNERAEDFIEAFEEDVDQLVELAHNVQVNISLSGPDELEEVEAVTPHSFGDENYRTVDSSGSLIILSASRYGNGVTLRRDNSDPVRFLNLNTTDGLANLDAFILALQQARDYAVQGN